MKKTKKKEQKSKSQVIKKQAVTASKGKKLHKAVKKPTATKLNTIKKKRTRRKTSKATLLKRKITMQKKRFLKMYSTSGANVSLVCDLFPIARSTFYRWYKEDENFAAEIDDCILIAIDQVENKLFKKCLNDDYDKQLTAIMYYLNNKKYNARNSKYNIGRGTKSGKARSIEDISKVVVEAMGAITTLQANP